ncbi:MAG: ribbon-helix-helix domain-containing protein, partial [Planktothrix sp.]|uniref:ribbon-helix-helix domain-containing protein n=2 Tax=Planktothrix sp. TaxID=3088171 RepID=UPI0038D4DB96
ITQEMPTKLKRLSIYLEPEVKDVIETMATDEQRSLANMISVLITEALTNRGITPTKKGKS